MIKRWSLIAGLTLWGFGALAATDRAGAVADMEKRVAELGALLEAQSVTFQPEALASNVLEAVIRAIDPGAAIMTPEQVEMFQEEEKGVVYDVGLKLTLKDHRLKIVEVVPNGPAATAGVPSGALVEKIDDQSPDSLSLEQSVRRLRGRKNEPVTLTIRPEDKGAEARAFTMTRAKVQLPVISATELWPQQIGYLKINGLYEDPGNPIPARLNTWLGTNCVGMILDLRGANGMALDAVAEIAGLFVPSARTLFTVKDGFDKTLKTYAARDGKPLDRPVMILVDRDTRGAAELLAAVLQDCRGVMIVGTPTRGDDRLREPLAIAPDKVLYIAVKRLDVGKDSYNGHGVKPDISVPPSGDSIKAKKMTVEDDNGLFSGLSEQAKQDRALIARIGDDLILRRATDILLGLKALDLYTP